MKKYNKPIFVSSNTLIRSQFNEIVPLAAIGAALIAPEAAAAAAAGVVAAIALRVDIATSKGHLPPELNFEIS